MKIFIAISFASLVSMATSSPLHILAKVKEKDEPNEKEILFEEQYNIKENIEVDFDIEEEDKINKEEVEAKGTTTKWDWIPGQVFFADYTPLYTQPQPTTTKRPPLFSYKHSNLNRAELLELEKFRRLHENRELIREERKNNSRQFKEYYDKKQNSVSGFK